MPWTNPGTTGPYIAKAIDESGQMMRNTIAGALDAAYRRRLQNQQLELGQGNLALNRQRLNQSADQFAGNQAAKKALLDYYNTAETGRNTRQGLSLGNSEANRNASAQNLINTALLREGGLSAMPYVGTEPGQIPVQQLQGARRREKAGIAGAQAGARGAAANTTLRNRRLAELRGQEALAQPAELPGGPSDIKPLQPSERIGPNMIPPAIKSAGEDIGSFNQKQGRRDQSAFSKARYNAIQKSIVAGDYVPMAGDLDILAQGTEAALGRPLSPQERLKLEEAFKQQAAGGAAE